MTPSLPTPAGDVQARLSGLYVYPIKSCAGIALDEAVLAETGLALDRAWMVVDEAGDFLTQRDEPRMALVQVGVDSGEGDGGATGAWAQALALALRAPGMPPLRLPLAREGAAADASRTRVRVWKDLVPAFDMGREAAQWFSDALGRRLRLVRFDAHHRRLSSMKRTGGVEAPNQFADGYPLLVVSQAALDGLNRRLQAQGHAPVDMWRFRPNLVLEGLDAHAEDGLGPIAIEADRPVLLQAVKPCVRCPIPNIDPATARSDPAVGDTLQAYRGLASMDGAVCFGMNAIVRAGVGARLRLGQAVRADWRFD